MAENTDLSKKKFAQLRKSFVASGPEEYSKLYSIFFSFCILMFIIFLLPISMILFLNQFWWFFFYNQFWWFFLFIFVKKLSLCSIATECVWGISPFSRYMPKTFIVRDRPFSLQEGLWFYFSFRNFFSDNTRVRISIFFVVQSAKFFPSI